MLRGNFILDEFVVGESEDLLLVQDLGVLGPGDNGLSLFGVRGEVTEDQEVRSSRSPVNFSLRLLLPLACKEKTIAVVQSNLSLVLTSLLPEDVPASSPEDVAGVFRATTSSSGDVPV